MIKPNEKGLRKLFNYNVLLIVCVILAVALFGFVYFTGSQIQDLHTHYNSYINNECVCYGQNIVPNSPLVITEDGINPVKSVAVEGAKIGLEAGK